MRLWGVAAALLMLISCSQPDRRTSVLWTDSAEIAAAAERFNVDQTTWQVMLEYHADLVGDLEAANSGLTASPDLVVGRTLNRAATKASLLPLDFLLDQGTVSKAMFYRELLDSGMQSGELRLVPLTFDLPVLLYSTTQLPELEPLALTAEQVRAHSADFQARLKAKGTRLAFSPLWGRFPIDWLQASGTNFGEDFQGNLAWNPEQLVVSLKVLEQWTAAEGQGWKAQKEFTLKYLSTSPLALLRDGRILFYPSTLSEFLALPFDERRGVDFRYLRVQDKIAATDQVLWAGIPEASRAPEAAKTFLADFLSPARQKALLRWSRENEFRPFGLAGGLSSLTATNNQLPTLYPELGLKLPAPSTLTFWGSRPANWIQLRDQVVVPWLAGQNPGSSEALQEAITAYLKGGNSSSPTK